MVTAHRAGTSRVRSVRVPRREIQGKAVKQPPAGGGAHGAGAPGRGYGVFGQQSFDNGIRPFGAQLRDRGQKFFGTAAELGMQVAGLRRCERIGSTTVLHPGGIVRPPAGGAQRGMQERGGQQRDGKRPRQSL